MPRFGLSGEQQEEDMAETRDVIKTYGIAEIVRVEILRIIG